jgi:hypothetical protein
MIGVGSNSPNFGNVVTTFSQWYTGWTGQAPPVLPQAYMDPNAEVIKILEATAVFWANYPAAGKAIPPNVWTFPWQYMDLSTSGGIQAVESAIKKILSDPSTLKILSDAHLPAFDPTGINWSAVLASPFGQNIMQTASSIQQTMPKLLDFVQKGAACKLFDQAPNQAYQAWTSYVNSNTDPCLIVPKQLPDLPPSTTPATTTITTPATTTTPKWVWPVVIGVGVVGVGIAAFMMGRAKPSAAQKNPSKSISVRRKNPQRSPYDDWDSPHAIPSKSSPLLLPIILLGAAGLGFAVWEQTRKPKEAVASNP